MASVNKKRLIETEKQRFPVKKGGKSSCLRLVNICVFFVSFAQIYQKVLARKGDV